MTAEEFLKDSKNINYDKFDKVTQYFIEQDFIEFAKYHVQKALKEASQIAETEEELGNPYDQESSYYIVNKESILNAYPLENIK